jgi:hypothetical protein
VNTRRRLVLAAVLVAALAIGFGISKVATAPASEASAVAHRYTLRVGDKVSIPVINQRCVVYKEDRAPAPELFCARPLNPHHQVRIFRDRILIWKIGNSNHPVWSGKP